MTLAGNSTVLEKAAEARVEQLIRDTRSKTVPLAIGIRTATAPTWPGEPRRTIEGRSVLFVACPSVLSIVTALVDWDSDQDSVLAVLTDRDDRELDSGLLARLVYNRLHSVSSTTVLQSALGPGYDSEIARTGWLREALTELRAAGKLRPQSGHRFTLDDAHDCVLLDRIGARLDQLDRTELLAALSRPDTAQRWQSLPDEERTELTALLVRQFGEPAKVILSLAYTSDNPLPELLVADVLLREDSAAGGRLYGGYLHSRGLHRIAPSDDAVREAANTAVALVRSQLESSTTNPRTSGDSLAANTHLQRADEMLEEHAGEHFAASSDVLPRAFEQRLVDAAEDLNPTTLFFAEAHVMWRTDAVARERLERLRSALRLKQWMHTSPDLVVDNVGKGLRRHANELAWVDRAVNRARGAGDPHPSIAKTLHEISGQARSLRREIDLSFAKRLAHSLDRDPGSTVLVENVLREVIAPLAKQLPVLLIVVDGMSGAVAGELADQLVDADQVHWYETVRGPTEQREAVLAALPADTTYSRTSLFAAKLTTGTQETERRAFPQHRFWGRSTDVALFHKEDLGAGQQLGSDLEAALTGTHDTGHKQVVGVVLSTVDDAISAGRQSNSTGWSQNEIEHLRALMENARLSGRAVVLVSGHGHVPDHGTEVHSVPGAAARWRTGEATLPDEVVLAGNRVLTDGGRGVFAASDYIRYGNKARGYHGGATLAEIAIPVITLLPAHVQLPKGWHVRAAATAPTWWKINHEAELRSTPPEPVAAASVPRRKPKRSTEQDALFASPGGEQPGISDETLGRRLVGTETFTQAHRPVSRAPRADVFADVVDALAGANGHRMPLADVARAAGQANRNPRGLVAVLTRVLNRDGYEVLKTLDNGRTLLLDIGLLQDQFLENA
ncbi:BREX-2 system phosphatase PglZ [Saccharopolyspora sp. K220]|uniref:BREX-2 system phosphatase PglZ n=1 Tax=Saccharopolyspora soli TaxID=2926618 RepID=UPI001F5745E5|nr:BREX-2 system phosphatase PglZ [Saccharopolyspora soli]MCI2423452.1 BREX-2 system phosphatase PglZ [Saccharopolyspora soli]